MINDFFNWCVFALEVIGDFTGFGGPTKTSKNQNIKFKFFFYKKRI